MSELTVVRTSAGLRDALFEEMDALRNGKSNPSRAASMSKLAVQIINAAKMEAQFQDKVQQTANGESVISKPVLLGSV